jgi:hypothetical protein
VAYVSGDSCILRYTPAPARVAAALSASKVRAMEREKNSRAAAYLAHQCTANDASPSAASAPSATRLCVILQLPCPSVAQTAALVELCSMQQGGGACAVMVVQADGQVLQFSVASVAQLAPLRKSEYSARCGLPLKSAARFLSVCVQVPSNIQTQPYPRFGVLNPKGRFGSSVVWARRRGRLRGPKVAKRGRARCSPALNGE